MLNASDRYLITGGSGFLGRALIDRLAKLGIENLVVVARNEGNLIALKNDFPHIEIIPGDIADPIICRKACQGVDGIFHLAAFKHVTMAESNAWECIQSNVIGTNNLLVESMHVKPKFFCYVSTDKAAQVKGVYAATKFIGEAAVREFAKINPATCYLNARYGNVFGSTGSFIHKWRKAVEQGREIVINEPTATRFFFSVNAAVDLIMDLIQNGRTGIQHPNIKAVSMGTVLDAFKDICGRDGRVVRVKQIGLQYGENLHETMDGITFSDKSEQYTKDEFIAEFLS